MKSVSIGDFLPLPSGPDQYPLEFIERHHAVKLASAADEVVVGLANGAGPQLLQTLRSFHEIPVRFVAVDAAELSSYLGRILSGETGSVRSAGQTMVDRERLDRLAHDAPIVNLVNSLLIDGIRRRASDIHVEAFAGNVRVRYRIDGVLQNATQVSKESFAGISSRIKVMANLNIMERRLPQDGRITVNLLGRSFDIRVSIVPIADGESVVLRLFDRTSEGLALADLGFDGDQLETIRAVLASPHGLVLVTGPTGSGKTTTLTAVIRQLKSEERKIITIEDPVEYRLDGVDQIQTNEEIGLTFATLLRRVLRQDPDIVMVGEIRDAETAALAVRAALTGHLVLASLHTNDAVSSITRLTDMGIEPYLVAGVLRGVVAQRLVRRVCEECRTVGEPTEAQRVWWERMLQRAGAGAPTVRYTEPPSALPVAVGCAACRRTGYRGRTAVAEMFAVDAELEGLIGRREERRRLLAHLFDGGFTAMGTVGLSKVSRGITTVSEVERIGPV